ncbi:MAG: hypothetical protein GXP09_07555 [Gammaproteobacteria bacterium]|nr:hypothetical protein [Gammaproteobacteria bacterium]
MTKIINIILLLTVLCIVFDSQVVVAQDRAARSLYVIFDGSNSMWGELPDKSRKIKVARDVFNRLDASLFAGRDVALRLYGHRRAGDCSDTELAVPFGPADSTLSKISKQVNAVSPRGKTPITRSLQAALTDFGDRAGDILLISDGIETCDADPCELVRTWRETKVNVRVHVVGLGLTDMARDAMQCIADASGTQYLDANSDMELASAIKQTAASKAPAARKPDPQPQSARLEFKLSGVDKKGHYLPVKGTLTNASGKVVEVKSNHRYVFDGGAYTLKAGVPTLNGKTFQPVSKKIKIKKQGSTVIQVVVPRPAQIVTRFFAKGKEIRGVNATAYQKGQKLFNVRPGEDHFVLPGTYDFAASLNKDNQLKTTATVAAGEDKVIEFQAVETVRAVFKVMAKGQDKPIRQHQELLRDGKVMYKIHWNNGADVQPGVYTLRSDGSLTPYQIDNVKVVSGGKQVIALTVPFATVKPRYVFKTKSPSKDYRCWLVRIDANGKTVATSKAKQCDGREITVVEGRYKIRVWSRLGKFEPTEFSAVTGQTSEVLIQEK